MEAGNHFNTKTEALVTWLSEAGVRMSPKMKIADLRSEGRGRGVVPCSACGDTSEGRLFAGSNELVFSIPREAVLNIQSAAKPDVATSASASPIQDAVLAMPSWLGLTTCMINEYLKTHSRWAPYLAVLPQRLDSLVFWSESELSELQASSVKNKIGKIWAEDMFATHISPLRIENNDVNLCHRIASTIMAYAFDIPGKVIEQSNDNYNGGDGGEELVSDNEEEESTILCMVPLADMLNADGDKNNARLSCDNELLEMRTIKPIANGEEILNDYGPLPRSDLLRRYGYITDQYASYDVVELSTSSLLNSFRAAESFGWHDGKLDALSDSELEKRTQLAERECVYDESYDIVHAGADGSNIPDELLALVYILLLNGESLGAMISSRSSLPSRPKLSTELAGRVLVVLLELREREYATTVEEDQELLGGGSLPNRVRMAIQVRLGEKELLREAAQEARSFVGSNSKMRLSEATIYGGRENKMEEDAPRKKRARHN